MKVDGRFITLEGIEGAGKSTHLARIQRLLQARGIAAVATREPGGSPVGEGIRALLLDPASQEMASDTELLLMFAARAEHIEQRIRPALAQGAWVLCDRFTDATYAYQGGGRGLERRRIAVLEDLVQGAMRPDLTLLFDLPVATGLCRARGRSPPDRFESETLRFFEAVRAEYLAIARAQPKRVRIINAQGTPEQVSVQVRAVLEAFLDGMVQ